MTVTERYIILLSCIEDQAFGDQEAEMFWRIAADEVYENTGVYISAMICEHKLVCGEMLGCKMDEKCVQIVCVRNPSEFHSREVYFELLKRILLKVKKQMNNPKAAFTAEQIEFTYFNRVNETDAL